MAEVKHPIQLRLENNPLKAEIDEARKHQDHISFFIESNLSLSNSKGKSEFMQWLSKWMSKTNMKKLQKFLQFPLETAGIVQDDIIPQLQKVFEANNRHFSYVMNDVDDTKEAISYLGEIEQEKFFREDVWNALLFQHNSVLVTDLIAENEPINSLVDIHNIEGIDVGKHDVVKWIIYRDKRRGFRIDENTVVFDLWYYYTAEFFSVYTKGKNGEFILLLHADHDLGKCPAQFISPKPITVSKHVVRKSIFSNQVRRFSLDTSLRMTWDYYTFHGALPITTLYKQNSNSCGTQFSADTKCDGGWLATQDRDNRITFQFSDSSRTERVKCPVCNQSNPIQSGTVVKFPVPKFGPEEKPFDLNANFVKFPHGDVKASEWFKAYLEAIGTSIREDIVGTGKEKGKMSAQNELQVTKSFTSLENTLTHLSLILSNVRHEADEQILLLKFGPGTVNNLSTDYGSKFYLQNEQELVSDRDKAINPIERLETSHRIIDVRFRSNLSQRERERLLLELLPYNGLTDASVRTDKAIIDPIDYELRMNFNMYVSEFEGIVNAPVEVYIRDFFPDGTDFHDRVTQIKSQLRELSEKTLSSRSQDPDPNSGNDGQ